MLLLRQIYVHGRAMGCFHAYWCAQSKSRAARKTSGLVNRALPSNISGKTVPAQSTLNQKLMCCIITESCKFSVLPLATLMRGQPVLQVQMLQCLTLFCSFQTGIQFFSVLSDIYLNPWIKHTRNQKTSYKRWH